MGVEIQTTKPGDGVNKPRPGQTVTIHYIGFLSTGDKFDSSRDNGPMFSFTLGAGKVIRGLDEGVAQMSLGQRACLTITPDYGYGSQGIGHIPANSTLIFDVELFSFR